MPATYRADRNPDRKLRHAAWKGDLALAAKMLTQGIDIEGTDADGGLPRGQIESECAELFWDSSL
eukprot:SAG11_NODE_13410_length_656_cov_1.109515_1_plen_65_part_00